MIGVVSKAISFDLISMHITVILFLFCSPVNETEPLI